MNSYNNEVLTMFVVAVQTCSQNGIGIVVGSSYPIMVGPVICTKENIHVYYIGFAMVTD
jgi:hypothetical protein